MIVVLNGRFYYTYLRQQSLLTPSKTRRISLLHRLKSTAIWRPWKVLKPFEGLTLAVIVFAVIQLLVTTVLYFGGRHYHSTFGFYGNPNANPLQCRRGLDWIPSVAWQFIWCWVIGPYYLIKTRKIEDTHYWRIQTITSIIAS